MPGRINLGDLQRYLDYRFLVINYHHSALEYIFHYHYCLNSNKWAYFKIESSKSMYFWNVQAERNNLIYHSCKLDFVENLTPLDLWMTFYDDFFMIFYILLTILPTYSKLYIFVILIISRKI